MSLWAELKRRNVFRVGAAYLVASWLIIQIAGQITGPLNLPDSFATVVIVLLALGFPIALITAWIYEVTPEGVRMTSSIPDAAPGRQSAGRLNIVIVALLVAAVGLMAVDTLILESREIDTDPPMVTDADGAVPPIAGAESESPADDGADDSERLKLVVLPFDDGSQAGDQAYLAEGFAGEIRSTLSLVDGLDVLGDATSPSLKEQQGNVRALREDWDVDYVLSGSLLTAGDQLRIRVELTSTDDAEIVYTDNYERMFEDSFILLDEIADTVARAMQITLGVGEVGSRLGGTRNVAAFEEYLRAVDLPPLTLDNVRRSVALLERAVSIDQEFSLAWFELSTRSRAIDLFMQPQGGNPAAVQRADEAMDRVVELTPGLPELLLRDAFLPDARPDIFEAGRRFEEFSRVAAESGYPPNEIALVRAVFLFGIGRIGDAVALAERSHAVDPLNLFANVILAEAYAAQGRSEESLAITRDYIERTGRFSVELFGRTPYAALESGDEAIIERTLALWDGFEGAPGINGFINRMGRLRNEPEQALADLESNYRSGSLGPFGTMHMLPWAAYFGDTELALEILLNADQRSIFTNIPRPIMASVRRTEGFRNFLRDRGLVAYWRETNVWPDYCRPLGLNDFECF